MSDIASISPASNISGAGPLPVMQGNGIPVSGINWMGLWTLYIKEVRRFLKVYNQTLFAPLITALLFLAVFNLALGSHAPRVGNLNYIQFVGAGIIIMSIVQQSFANTSSSFVMGKVLGSLVDLLMPPLSAAEVMIAMIAAGITRGVLVGLLVGCGVAVFVPTEIAHPLHLIFYAVSSSMMLALLGLFAGIMSDSFDNMAAITSYIITPLSFLSGTFYSVHSLPHFWYVVSKFNPFFYMIDGFRYSMTGHADSSVVIGMIALAISNALLIALNYTLLARGYRIKT